MRAKLFFFITVFSVLNVLAQPDISWQKHFGGSHNDFGYDVAPTSDGGYIVTGYTQSNSGDISEYIGNQDVWVVKIDNSGNLQWENTYGGTSYEVAFSIEQTSDNGYIFIARTASGNVDVTENFGYEDIWVVKLDEQGDLQWQKSFGGSANDDGWEIHQTFDGGYILAGHTWIGTIHSDYYVIKLDSNGDLEWEHKFGYNADSTDSARTIKQTSDGGYIVAGYTIVLEFQTNVPDIWVVKLNPQGVIEWNSRLGGSLFDFAYCVQQTMDGGYIVSGYSSSNDLDILGNHGGYDIVVMKLNSVGDLQWQKSLGGSQDDRSFSVVQANDGGYVVSGNTNSTDGDVTGGFGEYDGWLVKLDASGTIVWQKLFGGEAVEVIRSIQKTTDDGYIFTGWINSDDTEAGTLNGDADFWVVKLEAETLGLTDISAELESELSIYPNPSNDKINIITQLEVTTLEVYNTVGGLVSKFICTDPIDVSKLSKGMYILKIDTNKGMVTKKLLIN